MATEESHYEIRTMVGYLNCDRLDSIVSSTLTAGNIAAPSFTGFI